MLETVNTATQTLAVNSDVAFAENLVQTGATVIHIPGSSYVSIMTPGYYYVSFGVDAAPSSAGNITVQLYQNGVAIDGAEAKATSGASTTIVHLGVSGFIVQVCPCCMPYQRTTSISVKNTGVESSVTNAYLTISKLR